MRLVLRVITHRVILCLFLRTIAHLVAYSLHVSYHCASYCCFSYHYTSYHYPPIIEPPTIITLIIAPHIMTPIITPIVTPIVTPIIAHLIIHHNMTKQLHGIALFAHIH